MPQNSGIEGQQDCEVGAISMFLLKVYILVDNWCMEGLVNHLIDLYQDSCQGAEVLHLKANGPLDGKLGDFSLEQVAWELRTN